MTFDAKLYKRQWMRAHRAKEHKKNLVHKGKCPITEILLDSKYHDVDCPCGLHKNVDMMKQETVLRITVIHGEYQAFLVKDGEQVSFNTYLTLREGGSFDIKL